MEPGVFVVTLAPTPRSAQSCVRCNRATDAPSASARTPAPACGHCHEVTETALVRVGPLGSPHRWCADCRALADRMGLEVTG